MLPLRHIYIKKRFFTIQRNCTPSISQQRYDYHVLKLLIKLIKLLLSVSKARGNHINNGVTKIVLFIVFDKKKRRQ